MHQPRDRRAFESAAPAGGRVHVRIRDLVKRFGAFTALAGVSLEIGEGELVCFLGPSGCGKTTLLRAIAGLDPQDAGTIEIAGRDVSRAPPAARDFGIVFQSYALFPNLTATDNVGYGLVNQKKSRRQVAERVAELLALVGLPEQGAKYPAQLSGGQQQRVALARALATGPSLLLLDEPLSALDARVRVRLRDEIKDLQRRLGITTIMVTHDQEEALSMANRIVVMNQGRIDQIGTPEAIYNHPASAFVADFVGTMNFLDAIAATDGTILAGGLRLALARPQPAGPIRIGFRPETLEIRGVATDTPNRFRARVAALAFLGSFYRVTLVPEAAPALSFVADVGAEDAGRLGLDVGAVIDAAIPPAALVAFPATGGPPA